MALSNYTDSELYVCSIRLSPYITLNKVRLAASSGNLTIMGDNTTAWQADYLADEDPSTHTKLTGKAKVTARIAMEVIYNAIWDDAPMSALLDADYLQFNRTRRTGKSTPSPEKDYAPTNEVVGYDSLVHHMKFIDKKAPASQKMPDRQRVFLEYCIFPKGTDFAKLVFDHADLVTEVIHDIIYDPADSGQCAYVRTRYVNSVGHMGPPSEILPIVIP